MNSLFDLLSPVEKLELLNNNRRILEKTLDYYKNKPEEIELVKAIFKIDELYNKLRKQNTDICHNPFFLATIDQIKNTCDLNSEYAVMLIKKDLAKWLGIATGDDFIACKNKIINELGIDPYS